MKRLIFGGLSVLLLSAATTPAVRAEQQTAINATTLRSINSNSQLTAFNLFYLARDGYLKEQGIPGYQPLKVAYAQGLVNAKSIVTAAVKANRLDPKYLNDQSYISAVDVQLREYIVNN